jgi:DNA invertase Pin-like site-specific DNA recombinase/FtsZ-binding cell division protein ZapB
MDTTALYIRLSQDDRNPGESDSVRNQRDLLTDFVSNHPDLRSTRVLTFIDDGWSGTNFNRPKVKEMLNLAKRGEIQNIAVKDFSRFGRSYIKVGTYLEQIFPFLGVRFFSVTDCFDSRDGATTANGIEVAFKTFLHELYSKDISIKSMSGKLAKASRGEHVMGWPPYGYDRSATVRNGWDVDEAAAATVRRMFEMAAGGQSVCRIAARLNAEGVPTPKTHRRDMGSKIGQSGRIVDETPHWTIANVSKILRNEQYAGKLVTRKTRRVRVGSRQSVALPECDWVIVPDAHPAIVPQELFDRVQSMLGPYHQRKLNRINANILSNKVICVHCGHAMRRHGGARMRNVSFVCRSHSLIQREPCMVGRIFEADLKSAVLDAVTRAAALAQETQRQAEQLRANMARSREDASSRIKILKMEIERLKNGKAALFEDYADGRIDRERFRELNSERTSAIERADAELSELSAQMDESATVAQNERFGMISPFSGATELTPEMMALIDRILVFSAERIEIRFAFADLFTSSRE